MLPEDESIRAILEPIIGPWYKSLENPAQAQEMVLYDLLKKYGTTEYGEKHAALQTAGIQDYQRNFEMIDYKTLQPFLAKFKQATTKQSCLNQQLPG